MRQLIYKAIQDAKRAVALLEEPRGLAFIEQAAAAIVRTFRQGGKLLIAGNGGSLCDAMHFAEELTGHFRQKRAALPAMALADPGAMSAISNDYCFEEVFARGVEAFGKPGDLFVALTTSGNSANLLKASRLAKERQMGTVAFLGRSGGKMKDLCDLEWIVSGFEFSDRIQEAHMAAIHIILETVEQELFG